MNSVKIFNADGSVEFQIEGDFCIAKILEESLNEDGIGASHKEAYRPMIVANTSINIIDFTNVSFASGACWGYFVALKADLQKNQRIVRFVGLTGQPLDRFCRTRHNSFFEYFNTIEDAINGDNSLNSPHALS